MHDRLGPLQQPAPLTPEHRVLVLEVAAYLLLSGKQLPDYAADLLGTALALWLLDGGDLEHLLGVRPPRGSRRTPANLASWIEDGVVPVPDGSLEPVELAELRQLVGVSSR